MWSERYDYYASSPLAAHRHMCQQGREDMSSYSEGQTHQLMEALQAKGFTAEHVTKLGQYDRLGDLRLLFDGLADIVISHIIDLDADPFVPEGCEVEEHIRGGQFAWTSAKVGLYLTDQQESHRLFVGHHLYHALKDQRVLNANALDDLLANPSLIPEEWKGKRVFFWGTIYRSGSDGGLFVRCLRWDGRVWWGTSWPFEFYWRNNCPAAVLVA